MLWAKPTPPGSLLARVGLAPWGVASRRRRAPRRSPSPVGSSTTSIEDAVKNAVSSVAQRRRNLRWLEVVETRCHLENDAIAHWQVTVRIGAAAE